MKRFLLNVFLSVVLLQISIAQSYNEKWYRTGDKLIHNKDSKAFNYFQYVANKGNEWGEVGIGECYSYGVGCEQDYVKSIMYYKKAATKGNKIGMNNLGYAYYAGEGVEQNYTEAVKWFTKAANEKVCLSQYYLGLCYLAGNGTPQNKQEGIQWLTKSAKQKDDFAHMAQFQLGYSYYVGDGVPKNFQKAVKWFTLSANQGNAVAQYLLGLCYYNGNGVNKNVTVGVKWLQRAADQGYAMAQCNLGYLYEDGIIVNKDKNKAIAYQAKAATQGYEPAMEAYKRLTGREYEPKEFDKYAKYYVEKKIRVWQQKGEFESTTEYTQRVNKDTRQQKINEYIQEAENNFINRHKGELSTQFSISPYDADNESFILTSSTDQIAVKVPRKEAQQFKTTYYLDMGNSTLGIADNKTVIKEYVFKANGKSYRATNDIAYNTTEIKYNFDPIEVNLSATTAKTKNTPIAIGSNKIEVGSSEVDINIPVTKVNNEKTFVLIIANENYQDDVASVPFARNDGKVFKEYCIKTFNIPETNITFVENATLNNIKRVITWLANMLNSYNGEAKAIVYYSGHGIPDEANGNAYILPVDGYGSDASTGYSLQSLYDMLGKVPAQSITYFMDACFSGAKREGGMLVAARGVAREAKKGMLSGNSVLFSAATGDQTAYPYKEQGHGLFTYFLLKKLQETEGNVSYSELKEYITTQISRESLRVNKKLQTPTIIVAPNVSQQWMNWKLTK